MRGAELLTVDSVRKHNPQDDIHVPPESPADLDAPGNNDAADALEAKHRFWTVVVNRLVSIAVVSGLVLVLIGLTTWPSIEESAPDARLVTPGTWLPALHAELSGRITPANTLTCAIALFAGCATITVALAIGKASSLTVQEQAIHSQWRILLEVTALLAAVGAVLLAGAAWIGPEVRETSGISLMTCVFAMMCLLMVLSISGKAPEPISFFARMLKNRLPTDEPNGETRSDTPSLMCDRTLHFEELFVGIYGARW